MVEANKPSEPESAAANRAANRAGRGNGGATAAAVAMPIEDGAFSFDELLKQSATVSFDFLKTVLISSIFCELPTDQFYLCAD